MSHDDNGDSEPPLINPTSEKIQIIKENIDVRDSLSSEDNTQKLYNAVFEKRPVLKEIVDKHGKKSLYDYSREYFDVNSFGSFTHRQNEFLKTIKEIVEPLLGEEVTKSTVNQLKKYYFVSTADHHGPITSPFFINSNLAAITPFEDFKDDSLQNMIVLACANVSLNNSSFPRGLLFNSIAGDEFKLHRLSFLPSNSHSCAVYNFRPYIPDEIKKINTMLNEKKCKNEISQDNYDKLKTIIDEVYNQKEIFECKSYSEQITKTNFHLWKRFFHNYKGKIPNLIYLEQESLVSKLIVDNHLKKNVDTVISHVLLDSAYDPLMLKYFEKIMGAFSVEEGWGTYLFWAISDEKNYRVALWKKGNKLVSEDGSYSVDLEKEALIKALESKTIIPSMQLIFMVLSFYYGIKCLGGFSQVNYLTFMKNAFIKMMVDRGNYKSIEICAQAQTKEILGDVSVAYLENSKGVLAPATGLDLILYGNDELWPKLKEEARHITIEEALMPMMPEFYKIIYPEPTRDPVLLSITSDDIGKKYNIHEKLEAYTIKV